MTEIEFTTGGYCCYEAYRLDEDSDSYSHFDKAVYLETGAMTQFDGCRVNIKHCMFCGKAL